MRFFTATVLGLLAPSLAAAADSTTPFRVALPSDFQPAQVFKNKDGALYTTSTGAPVLQPYAAQRIGKVGPLLLQGTSSTLCSP